MYLKIQVLGSGIIPRGLGIAPRREPFKADLLLIQTILASPCKFKVNMVHPVSGQLVEVTRKNLQSLWEKYGDFKGSYKDLNENSEENNSGMMNDDASAAKEKDEAPAEKSAKHAVPVTEKVEESVQEDEDPEENPASEEDAVVAEEPTSQIEVKEEVADNAVAEQKNDDIPVMPASDVSNDESPALSEDEIPVQAVAEEKDTKAVEESADNTIQIPAAKTSRKKK